MKGPASVVTQSEKRFTESKCFTVNRTVIVQPDKYQPVSSTAAHLIDFNFATMDNLEPPTGAAVIVGPVPPASLAEMTAFRVGKRAIDVIEVVQSLSQILVLTLIDGSMRATGQLAIMQIAVFGAEHIGFLKDKISKPVALCGLPV